METSAAELSRVGEGRDEVLFFNGSEAVVQDVKKFWK